MKLRNPTLIHFVAMVISWMLRLWCATLLYRYRPLGRTMLPVAPDQEPTIYAFWHEGMFFPGSCFGRREIKLLISQHSDGELVARICRHCGFSTVRGSSSRGGVRAMRQMIRDAETSHYVILPDGPRGPRRRLEPGLLYLAARSQQQVVLVGIGYDRPWRLRTWDRFVVPRPFTKIVMITSEPLRLPHDLSGEALERIRLEWEAELTRLTDEAERLAEGRPAVAVNELRRAA
jgi:lysophospholipid acyltransferase (LPLAT)-like uncharacterized protein